MPPTTQLFPPFRRWLTALLPPSFPPIAGRGAPAAVQGDGGPHPLVARLHARLRRQQRRRAQVGASPPPFCCLSPPPHIETRCCLLPPPPIAHSQADIFMSHEGLQLAYEEALTRAVRIEPPATPLSRASSLAAAATAADSPLRPRVRSGGAATPLSAARLPAAAAPRAVAREAHYNLGTHFVWIGG